MVKKELVLILFFIFFLELQERCLFECINDVQEQINSKTQTHCSKELLRIIYTAWLTLKKR